MTNAWRYNFLLRIEEIEIFSYIYLLFSTRDIRINYLFIYKKPLIYFDIYKIIEMNKFFVLMACAMFIFAFVHMAHADDDDENDSNEYGRNYCKIYICLVYLNLL